MKTNLDQEKIAVVFPGQGNQCFGLGRSLINAYPEARKRLDRFSDITDTDLYHLHTSEPDQADTNSIDTVAVHLAMVSYGLLSWELLTRIYWFKPSIVAGHSLGEITALACAGVIEPEDAMRLAKLRGRLIAETSRETTGGMMALVGLPVDEIRSQVAVWQKAVQGNGAAGGGLVFEANINAPGQLVVSGRVADLNALEKQLAGFGVSTIPLPVSGAFHSPYMNSAATRFLKALEKIKFNSAQLPVVSSMTGRLVSCVSGLSTQLTLQMVNPVKWLKVMSVFRKAGVQQIVEAGPGNPVLCQLAKSDSSWKVNARSVPGFLENYGDSNSNANREDVL